MTWGNECEVEETEWLSYGGEGCDTYRHTLSCGHVSETFDEEPPNFCCKCGAKVRKVRRCGMSDCSENAWCALPDREPSVLYIHGISIPGLDFADYKAVEVDGHRFERVRECKLKYHDTGWASCSECNRSWKDDRPHVYRRCPYCGARVKGVDA